MKRREICLLAGAVLLSVGCSDKEIVYNDTCPGYVVDCSYKHAYGIELSGQDWQKRGCDGEVTKTLKNGVIVCENYKNGVLEGETTRTFPHTTTVEVTETYKNGNLICTRNHYLSGTPKDQHEWTSIGNEIVTSWYESGSLMSVEETNKGAIVAGKYYTPEEKNDAQVVDGNGQRIVRDPYGELTSTDKIQNGYLTERTVFYPNHSPKEIIPYKAGMVSGTKRTYFPLGEPNTTEEWLRGEQHGLTVYYRNGEKYAEVPFERGLKNGVERRYRQGNQLQEEVSWSKGVRQGPTRSYVGSTVKTDWYVHDKLVNKQVYDQMIK